MSTTESPEEALARIQAGFSNNDKAVLIECFNRGLHPSEIAPRENVLTLHAWRAKGRRVAKGAISIHVLTWVPCRGRQVEGEAGEESGGEESGESGGEEKRPQARLRPKTAFLFHISQTVAKDAPRDTRPGAWANPALIRPGIYDVEASAPELAEEATEREVVTA